MNEKTDVQPGGLSLEIGLNKPTDAFITKIDDTNPSALVLELKQARLGKIKSFVALNQSLAKNIKFEQVDKSTVRITIQLTKDVNATNYKVYTLPKDARAKKPFRIVLDFQDGSKFFSSAGVKGKTIILDPGHGGSDPGAIGPNRVREKDVTLNVAMKVKYLLQDAGARVIMTRSDDRDVYGPNASDKEELQARVNVARKNTADIFVSIHANSFINQAAHGTSTYYYEKSTYDSRLAESLQNGLVEFGGLYDRGIQEANFYVVKRTNMPAALVELAFISNPKEERLLNSAEFQQKLAEGICKGLSDFFSQTAK